MGLWSSFREPFLLSDRKYRVVRALQISSKVLFQNERDGFREGASLQTDLSALRSLPLNRKDRVISAFQILASF